MPHEPFIIGAYSFAAVALVWCAVAPLVRARQLARTLRDHHRLAEDSHAPRA